MINFTNTLNSYPDAWLSQLIRIGWVLLYFVFLRQYRSTKAPYSSCSPLLLPGQSYETATFCQKTESIGQESATLALRFFSKGIVKHTVRCIRTFTCIEVAKFLAHMLGRGTAKYAFTLSSILESRVVNVWGCHVLSVCPSVYMPI
jgi:hypothetical protein